MRSDFYTHSKFIFDPFAPLSSTAALMLLGSGGTIGPSPCCSFTTLSSCCVTNVLGRIEMVNSVERTVPITLLPPERIILLGIQNQKLPISESGMTKE